MPQAIKRRGTVALQPSMLLAGVFAPASHRPCAISVCAVVLCSRLLWCAVLRCAEQGGEGAECGAREWPYLRFLFVPAWQLAVFSYRKALDDHIKLLDVSQGTAVPLEQAEYANKLGIPTGVDDSDNFVTGLAVDYSHKVSWGRSLRGGGLPATAHQHYTARVCSCTHAHSI